MPLQQHPLGSAGDADTAPSACTLLRHLLATAHEAPHIVASVVLDAIWTRFSGEWCAQVNAFCCEATREALDCGFNDAFRRALASLILCSEASLRCGASPDLVDNMDRTVFGMCLPALVQSFRSAHDPLWDELCAAMLQVLAVLSESPAKIERDDAVEGVPCCRRPEALAWCRSIIQPVNNAVVSPICQNVTLLMAVGMGLDRPLVEGSDCVREGFHATFLQCANMLSDTVLITLLLHAIRRGTIRGNLLYATDLGVLLCVLSRMRDGEASISREGTPVTTSLTSVIDACEALLLRDIAPSASASTAEVGQWLQRLGLRGDYQSIVRQQGIDGDVLWSDLTTHDIVDMGVHHVPDAQKIARILSAERT